MAKKKTSVMVIGEADVNQPNNVKRICCVNQLPHDTQVSGENESER